MAQEAEAEQRRLELDDLKFLSGDQWPDQIKNQRAIENRPCLTVNRLPGFVQQITNEQRQNRPSIKVSPIGDGADQDTAKIIQGLIRHIEYYSSADVAYDTAFAGGAGPGRGFFRILTDYCDPESFDQEILIKRIANHFQVYMDPNYKEADGSDMQWCFVTEDMTKEAFKALYPDAEVSTMDDWRGEGDRFDGWLNDHGVRVAEYFYIEYDDEELWLLADGSSVLPSQLDKEAFKKAESLFKQKRKTKIPRVKWRKINGLEILEETDLPGEYIPIIPVFGNELNVDGKRIYEGIIRHAKDPQRMRNFWTSAATEAIALAPRAPFIVAEGQLEGHADQWQTANTKSHSFLQYRPISFNGQSAPPPQRNAVEPPVQAIMTSLAQSDQDLYATTNIYKPTVGDEQPDQSGVAIQRLNTQAQTSNFHFIDNLSRALRHAGRIIVQWIPHIYDGPRTIRIIGDDGTEDLLKVNQAIGEDDSQSRSYSLDKGDYDVTIDVGPSYQTRRQEAVASMLDFIKSYPPGAQLVGDLLVKNMDWPGAREVAERLRKIVPPGIADDPNKKSPPIPPEAQQQMSQMNQMIQMLTQELQAAASEIKTRKFDLESKERIALINAQTQLQIAAMKSDSVEAIEGFRQEVNMIEQRLEALKFDQSMDQEMNLAGMQTQALPGNQTQPGTGAPSPG